MSALILLLVIGIPQWNFTLTFEYFGLLLLFLTWPPSSVLAEVFYLWLCTQVLAYTKTKNNS